jgi:hypothetical protein
MLPVALDAALYSENRIQYNQKNKLLFMAARIVFSFNLPLIPSQDGDKKLPCSASSQKSRQRNHLILRTSLLKHHMSISPPSLLSIGSFSNAEWNISSAKTWELHIVSTSFKFAILSGRGG